jgi:hypothetical protein
MNTLTIGTANKRPKSVTLNTLGAIGRLLQQSYSDAKIHVSLVPITENVSTPAQDKYKLELLIPQKIVLKDGQSTRVVDHLLKVYVYIFDPIVG